MSHRAVDWHEGMFLRPHHFQAAQRHGAGQAHLNHKWDLHYNWGLRAIELDHDALANQRLIVRSLQARMRDGTLISVPEDGVLPQLELQNAFQREQRLTIYLAVPIVTLGRANVAETRSAEGPRYLVDWQELEDENTGVSPQNLRVRLLNLQLLLSTQDHAGFETLPIARIEKSDAGTPIPRLDVNYFPPVLACEAWKPLQVNVLEQIYDRVGSKLKLLAEMISTRGVTFDSQGAGDPKLMFQLRVVNEAYAYLGTTVFALGMHPLGSYAELCRLVGQLAILGETRRTPELPRYDHDNLANCFYTAKKYIDALLDQVEQPLYKARPFEGSGLMMKVVIDSSWLEVNWIMFVGVQCPLRPEDTVALLTKPVGGSLNMKIGSPENVEEIFKRGMMGLKFAPTAHPPRALPRNPGLVYFQIDRESTEWAAVQKSLSVGVRLNEKQIEGDIQGKKTLSVRYQSTAGPQLTTMQFTLYAVPKTST